MISGISSSIVSQFQPPAHNFNPTSVGPNVPARTGPTPVSPSPTDPVSVGPARTVQPTFNPTPVGPAHSWPTLLSPGSQDSEPSTEQHVSVDA